MTDSELLRLRDSIDNIDAALVHLLAERFKCTQAFDPDFAEKFLNFIVTEVIRHHEAIRGAKG